MQYLSRFFAILAGLLFCSGVYAADCLIVKEASIVDRFELVRATDDFERMLQIANHGHVLTRGSGVVFVYRDFEEMGGIDSAAFAKITFPIDSHEDGVYLIEGMHVTVGASGFVRSGNFSRVLGASGHLVFQTKDGRLNADAFIYGVEVGLSAHEERGGGGFRKAFSCSVAFVGVDELNSWFGAPGRGDSFYYKQLRPAD
ncbi:MAG: hypothetical protein Q4F49_02120 [Pseudoxanthomonas suwonensis]|nr:hypothetical protein [Pseudoxanthomonas suwonensis]MDO5505077.1 hypothetical protein [Pseudoxanthomonas suwonensis]